MDEEIREVIVDTYAIISDFNGTIPRRVYSIMEGIRTGIVKGIVHSGIIYELVLLWLKGRLPFKDLNEVSLFVEGYFQYVSLDIKDIFLAGQIKMKGDSMLADARDPSLRGRRLSFSDASSIALAIDKDRPIISGDADLTYVARNLGVNVIW